MNIFKPEYYDHKYYKYCKDEKDADAIAWTFVNSSKFIKFPFKFPELKPDEIRANVLYTGLCHTDSANGHSQMYPANYPLTPGHEIIAEVALLGSDVKDYEIGEKVAFGVIRRSCEQCKYCQKGKINLCPRIERADKDTYGTFWGGWATQIQQPAKYFFKLPENIDLRRAAPLVCAGNTVYGPIKTFAETGDKCAIVGIGGLGHFAVEIMSKMGYDVTAITHSGEKKEDILSMGANEVIFIDDKEKLKEYKDRFDFVLNTLPTTEHFNEILSLCAPECKYVMVGIPPFNQELKLDFKTWIFKDIILVGSLNDPRYTDEFFSFCVDKKVYPIVEEYSFDDFPKALERMEQGKSKFRCIVNVGDFSKKEGLFKLGSNQYQ